MSHVSIETVAAVAAAVTGAAVAYVVTRHARQSRRARRIVKRIQRATPPPPYIRHIQDADGGFWQRDSDGEWHPLAADRATITLQIGLRWRTLVREYGPATWLLDDEVATWGQ